MLTNMYINVELLIKLLQVSIFLLYKFVKGNKGMCT
jgi:hypothetical protein